MNSSSSSWVKTPKKRRLDFGVGIGWRVAGSTARIVNMAETKADAPRTSSGSGAVEPRALPIDMVKITKVAPIMMLAFWSAIAESWSWASWMVRIRCTALAG